MRTAFAVPLGRYPTIKWLREHAIIGNGSRRTAIKIWLETKKFFLLAGSGFLVFRVFPKNCGQIV